MHAREKRTSTAEVALLSARLTGDKASTLACQDLMLTWPDDSQTDCGSGWSTMAATRCDSLRASQKVKGQPMSAPQCLSTTRCRAVKLVSASYHSSGCLAAVASLLPPWVAARRFDIGSTATILPLLAEHNAIEAQFFVSLMPLPRLNLAASRGVSIGAMLHRTRHY